MPPALKLKFKPVWLVTAIAAVLSIVVALYIATGLETSARKRIASLARANESTLHANAELAEFSDEMLNKTRAQAEMFRATLLSEARIATFKKEQQLFWRVNETSSETTPEYRKIRIELTRLGAPMSDWPQIVDTVQKLQSSPGMTVRQVEVLTSGDNNQRSFERVSLGVSLFVRLADKD